MFILWVVISSRMGFLMLLWSATTLYLGDLHDPPSQRHWKIGQKVETDANSSHFLTLASLKTFLWTVSSVAHSNPPR